MDAPEFRSTHCRAGLRAASTLPQGRAIRADIGDESLRALEDTFRLSWLPLRHHMKMVEAVRKHSGDDGLYAMWRAVSLESYDWPVMRIPLDGIRRLFGLSPATLASQLPRFWPLFARGIGTCTWKSTGHTSGVLTLTDVPTEHFRSGTLALGLAGGFASLFDVCEVPGRVTARDRARDIVEFVFGW